MIAEFKDFPINPFSTVSEKLKYNLHLFWKHTGNERLYQTGGGEIERLSKEKMIQCFDKQATTIGGSKIYLNIWISWEHPPRFHIPIHQHYVPVAGMTTKMNQNRRMAQYPLRRKKIKFDYH